jgi:hypothetical protein
MSIEDKCQIKGCDKESNRIAGIPEGGIIEICDDHWHDLYKL